MNLAAKVRAFIAIDVPIELKQTISRIQRDLASLRDGKVAWVKPDGVHLTLHFIGDVEKEKIPELVTCIKVAVGKNKDFTLQTTSQGAFPRMSQPKTYWIGVEGGSRLVELYQNISTALDNMGFAHESGKFHPHLTVGRVKELPSGSIMSSEFAAMTIPRFSWKAGTVKLMSSHLLPTGAEYDCIQSVEFLQS